MFEWSLAMGNEEIYNKMCLVATAALTEEMELYLRSFLFALLLLLVLGLSQGIVSAPPSTLLFLCSNQIKSTANLF